MQVRLHGSLAFYGPARRERFEVAIEDEPSLADAVARIGVPVAEVGVAGRNGEVVRIDDPTVTVTDADRIDLFPPSSGG